MVEKLISIILNYIIHYRKSVIELNLSIIYPNISEVELTKKKKAYYAHLSNLFLESLWSYRASPQELYPKVKIKNTEVFQQIYDSGQNATILLSHIGNWELFCQWAPLFIPNLNVVILYTPLKNLKFNEVMLKIRQRFRAIMVSTKSTLELFRIQKSKNVCINLFAIDQNPGDPYHQHWLNVFGVNIPVISGAEKFARSQHQKVYFLYVKKAMYYELELIELPYDTAIEYSLTDMQFKLLEKNILENPSLWLLSHNRFKYRK